MVINHKCGVTKIYTPRKYRHPGFPFVRGFRYPVVIIGTPPFDCKRWERLIMTRNLTALTVRSVVKTCEVHNGQV